MLRGFSGGKQEIKSVNTRMQSSLLYLHYRKLRRFDLKNENGKIWVEVILNTVRDSRNLHSKELWCKTCQSLHFAFCVTKMVVFFFFFEGINKPDRDYSITSIGNFITCVPSIALIPSMISLKVRAKIECNMNKVYQCFYSSVSLIMSWNVFLHITTSKRYQ